MDDLSGRVAVVTGGASGIGLALGERLAAAGMRVVLADVNGDSAVGAARRIAASTGAEVVGERVDVASWDQMDELASRVRHRFGAVHVLCNNAGVQMPGRTWEFTPKEWDWLLGINLGGVVHGIKSFVPAMVERGEPAHVVNTASVGGLIAYPTIAMYTASKFAVVGLSECLAHDLKAAGAPIGVSVLCPGPTVSSLRENSAELRPGGGDGRDVPSVSHHPRRPAADVAAMAVEAIRHDRFWILTHPELNDLIRRRTEGILTTDELVAPGPI